MIAETARLREENKTPPPPPKPTQEELLAQILEELQKQNAKENAVVAKEKVEKK